MYNKRKGYKNKNREKLNCDFKLNYIHVKLKEADSPRFGLSAFFLSLPYS